MRINQLFKNYTIIFIALTLTSLMNFESMVASALAMILSLLIVKDEK